MTLEIHWIGHLKHIANVYSLNSFVFVGPGRQRHETNIAQQTNIYIANIIILAKVAVVINIINYKTQDTLC